MFNFSLVLSVFLQSSHMNSDEDIKFLTQISCNVKARYFSLVSLPNFKPLSIQGEKKKSSIHSSPPTWTNVNHFTLSLVTRPCPTYSQSRFLLLGFCVASIKQTTLPSCLLPLTGCQFNSDVTSRSMFPVYTFNSNAALLLSD